MLQAISQPQSLPQRLHSYLQRFFLRQLVEIKKLKKIYTKEVDKKNE